MNRRFAYRILGNWLENARRKQRKAATIRGSQQLVEKRTCVPQKIELRHRVQKIRMLLFKTIPQLYRIILPCQK